MAEREFRLTNEQKRALLKAARTVIESAVTGRSMPKPSPPDDPVLNQQCGCFVTLHVAGRLRGCIGTFIPDDPLYQTVDSMARSSLRDPRFVGQPIGTDELNDLDIEISVLSPLQLTEDPLALELGRHGIYIKKGFYSGCFLPQVAEETGWTKEQFLSYCCSHKAGLDPGAWQDGSAEVYLFTADVFGESTMKGNG